MRTILSILLALTITDYADACPRCGIFGRRCKFAEVKRVVTYPQQAVSSQTINIANFAYPVGATQYSSVAQISQLTAVNPALALEHSSRVAERSVSTMQNAIEALTANNQGVLELAKLQAATEHLRSALTTGTQRQTTTLRITQSASGIQVEQLAEDSPPGGEAGNPVAPTDSLLAAKCSQCHGLETNAPKAGIYFDAGHQLDASNAIKALRILEGQDVPEAMEGLMQKLSADDMSALRREIIGLTR